MSLNWCHIMIWKAHTWCLLWLFKTVWHHIHVCKIWPKFLNIESNTLGKYISSLICESNKFETIGFIWPIQLSRTFTDKWWKIWSLPLNRNSTSSNYRLYYHIDLWTSQAFGNYTWSSSRHLLNSKSRNVFLLMQFGLTIQSCFLHRLCTVLNWTSSLRESCFLDSCSEPVLVRWN